jgi:hypothetical protein
MRRVRGRLGFVLVGALGAAVGAAEMPLGGSKLLVQDPTGDPLRRNVVVVGAVPSGSTSNNHAAAFWWKTRSLRAVSPGLPGALPTG